MANKRIIDLQERTQIDVNDWLIVDSSTSTRKLSMATLFNYMTMTSMVFVTELPTTDISESTIYLLPHTGSSTQWDEYIYRDNEWVLVGTSTIDLSAIYQTKTDNNLQTTSKQIVGAINEVKSDLALKQTKAYTKLQGYSSLDTPAGVVLATTDYNEAIVTITSAANPTYVFSWAITASMIDELAATSPDKVYRSGFYNNSGDYAACDFTVNANALYGSHMSINGNNVTDLTMTVHYR